MFSFTLSLNVTLDGRIFETLFLGSRTRRRKRGRLPAQEADLPAVSHKTWQAGIPDILLGRTRHPATVAPLPACPRTAALRLALCPSLSRVSPFTFVLSRAHLPAFHSHFLTAHNTGTVFLKKIL
jgi:hypothetical protein